MRSRRIHAFNCHMIDNIIITLLGEKLNTYLNNIVNNTNDKIKYVFIFGEDDIIIMYKKNKNTICSVYNSYTENYYSNMCGNMIDKGYNCEELNKEHHVYFLYNKNNNNIDMINIKNLYDAHNM